MSNELVVFGVGSLAKFLIPELSPEYNVTGLSRSFSCSVNKEIKYIMGQPIDTSLSKAPKCVIVNFPPREELLNTLKSINSHFDINVPVIFVSSTSIYKSGTVTEATRMNVDSRLYPFEQFIESWQRPAAVVRPGGLFDKTRNPANFFRNRSEVSGSDYPVNMVHSFDAALFIKYVLDNELYNEVFNLVASTHPTKKEFYGKAMELAGVKLPAWVAGNAIKKIVLNDKSKATGFRYKYDDLLLALDSIN